MKNLNDREISMVVGGIIFVPSDVGGACSPNAFIRESFAQSIAGAGIGLFTGGPAGAGLGFLGGVVSGNLYQGGLCAWQLMH